jgi:putative DNA primase/helicase
MGRAPGPARKQNSLGRTPPKMQYVAPFSLIGDSNIALHLHFDHSADLRASGLSDDTIKAAGVHSLAPRWLERFFHRVPDEIESALCFPYQGSEFARIKLFPALGKMKYAQSIKTGARLYLPFPVTAGALYVCEGEKKTLAAHQAGLNAAGIGGLWNWLNCGEPIDDLNLIEWDNRDAVLIPDSDVFSRVELMRPLYALGRTLRDRGAVVSVAVIPQHSGVKGGLDDYLVAGGAVDDLETFTLDQRMFQAVRFWYGQWKFKRALMAA